MRMFIILGTVWMLLWRRYFHRAPRRANTDPLVPSTTAAGGYRGGTRKGLDLTFGGPVLPLSSQAATTSKFFTKPPTDVLYPPFLSLASVDLIFAMSPHLLQSDDTCV